MPSRKHLRTIILAAVVLATIVAGTASAFEGEEAA
jgi:hypothetical protein